jgi:hypothetical protein
MKDEIERDDILVAGNDWSQRIDSPRVDSVLDALLDRRGVAVEYSDSPARQLSEALGKEAAAAAHIGDNAFTACEVPDELEEMPELIFDEVFVPKRSYSFRRKLALFFAGLSMRMKHRVLSAAGS